MTARDRPEDVAGGGDARTGLELRRTTALLLVHSIEPNPDGVAFALRQLGAIWDPARPSLVITELANLVGTYATAVTLDGLRREIYSLTAALDQDDQQ